MNYQQAVHYLNSLQLHTIKLGLESMTAFLSSVGNPQDSLRFVHLAGTNGKGSVCAALVSVLQEAGYQAGLYTSPHLYDVRERFKVNDRYISKTEFAAIVTRIASVLGEEKITYFECTTAIALLWFARMKPDIVVLETGLGGRLDATNVVEPLLSIITNISLDHEAYLGDTVQAVAFEKAGIIKPHVPVITGCEHEALTVIEESAVKVNAPLKSYGQEFWVTKNTNGSWNYHTDDNLQICELVSGLEGEYQSTNMSLAVTAALLLNESGYDISVNAISCGLKNVRWPGRLERVVVQRHDGARNYTVEYLLDGGHNPAGIASLKEYLQRKYTNKKMYMIWAAMKDKDSSRTLPELIPLVDRVYITRPDTKRSALAEDIVETLQEEAAREKCVVFPDVEQVVYEVENVLPENTVIVVAGSLYLVGKIRYILLGNLVEN